MLVEDSEDTGEHANGNGCLLNRSRALLYVMRTSTDKRCRTITSETEEGSLKWNTTKMRNECLTRRGETTQYILTGLGIALVFLSFLINR